MSRRSRVLSRYSNMTLRLLLEIPKRARSGTEHNPKLNLWTCAGLLDMWRALESPKKINCKFLLNLQLTGFCLYCKWCIFQHTIKFFMHFCLCWYNSLVCLCGNQMVTLGRIFDGPSVMLTSWSSWASTTGQQCNLYMPKSLPSEIMLCTVNRGE